MRILFISDEDECRGPLAVIAAERVAMDNRLMGFHFESAGLYVTESRPPRADLRTVVTGAQGILVRHQSRPLSAELLDACDVALTMTDAQRTIARDLFGEPLAGKIVQLVDAVQLTTRQREVLAPEVLGAGGLRRTYVALSAAIGRLIRMLDDPAVRAESFGAKTIPKGQARRQQAHHNNDPPRQENRPPPQAAVRTIADALVIFGLKEGSPPEEIRRRYLDLLKRYHPDRFHDDEQFRALAEDKTKRINSAWELLRPRD